MYTLETLGEQETLALGESLGGLLAPPVLLSLNGGFGAGKTVFARGVARGCGVREPVTSPTFTLLHIYHGRVPVYHFDFYRLEAEEELLELSLEEYFFNGGVVLVEWAEKFPRVLPGERLEVRLARLPLEEEGDEERRCISLQPFGPSCKTLVEELFSRC